MINAQANVSRNPCNTIKLSSNRPVNKASGMMALISGVGFGKLFIKTPNRWLAGCAAYFARNIIRSV
jgi:hypothetical protein